MVFLSYSCYMSVILLSYQCHTPVLYMSYSCRIYVILLSYLCHTPVVYMSYSCLIYVILLSYICHTHVVYMSYSCHILTLFSSAHDTVPLCVCWPGPWRGSISGRYVAEAAGLYCRWEQPRKRRTQAGSIAVSLPQEPPPFAVSSIELAEWIANNLADELRMRPASVDGWSSAQLNHILTSCLVSDRRGNNLHTFHTVEFDSDMYWGVMRARCYPFNMEEHRFRGKNIKVLRLRVH